jgi:phthiodiolone/phenolphthiodiolone dimycocerosates ketoreductase
LRWSGDALKVKFGLSAIAFNIGDFVEQAIRAEQFGFRSIWVADHYTDLPPSNDKYEPWTVLATMGAKTQRILLGTLATDSVRRHPSSIAHAVATLDNLTNGRVIIGIGAGEAMNVLPYGLPWENPRIRLSRLEETVKVIRLLWKSNAASPVNFEGRFYRLHDARLDLPPHNDRMIPIYIASLGSRRGLQLTGRVGDGWLPWFNTPETFVERSKLIDETAARVGRSPSEIEKTAVVYFAPTNDLNKQKYIMDSIKTEIVVLNSAQRLAKLGHSINAKESSKYSYQKCLASQEDSEQAKRLGATIPDSIAQRFLVMGTSRNCVDQLEELVSAGVQHMILRDMLWANGLDSFYSTLALTGREIIPAFN